MSKPKKVSPSVEIGDWVVRPTTEITVQDIVVAIADDYGDAGLVDVIDHMFQALDGELQEEVIAQLQLHMKPD